MSATEELRRLLDERGVEWETDRSGFRVMWGKPVDEFHDTMQFKAVDNALPNAGLNVHICGFTPEQAIAATLGSDREAELQKALNKAAGNWAKADDELRKALDFMRIWISEDAHLGESAISRELEKAEGLRNLDAIESAIATTPIGGKLTAEQVRDAWCGNLKRDCLYDPPTPDWQAIADELNARAERTCHMETAEGCQNWNSCSECDADYYTDQPINYCPNCGRKVVAE